MVPSIIFFIVCKFIHRIFTKFAVFDGNIASLILFFMNPLTQNGAQFTFDDVDCGIVRSMATVKKLFFSLYIAAIFQHDC